MSLAGFAEKARDENRRGGARFEIKESSSRSLRSPTPTWMDDEDKV